MTSDGSGHDFFTPAAPHRGTEGVPSRAAPTGSRVPGATPVGGRYGRAGTPSHLAPTTSRWARSDTTFGPVGRVVTSVFMVLPMVFFVAAGIFTMDPLVLGGVAVWGGLMYVGLKHVWAPVRR